MPKFFEACHYINSQNAIIFSGYFDSYAETHCILVPSLENLTTPITMIPTKDGEQNGLSPDAGMNVIGAGIPSVIILISYGYIWFKSRQNEKRMNNLLHKKSGNESDKLARTLLLICLSYLLFVVPFITYSAFIDVGFFEGTPIASITIYSFYWLQFCTNIFIYALSNDKYRKAYVFFLKHVLFKSCADKCKKTKPKAFQNAVFFTVSDQTVHDTPTVTGNVSHE